MSDNKLITIQSEARQISADMRKLYNRFEKGEVKREEADTMANISGKNLKALSIQLADKMFSSHLKNITPPKQKALTK